MEVTHEVVVEQVSHRYVEVEQVAPPLVSDLNLDALLEVEQVGLADWVAQQPTSFGRERLRLFVAEECLAVVGFESHQRFERSDSTNFSTLAERTCPAGTTRCSKRADALVERATNRRRVSADTVCLAITAPSLLPTVAYRCRAPACLDDTLTVQHHAGPHLCSSEICALNRARRVPAQDPRPSAAKRAP